AKGALKAMPLTKLRVTLVFLFATAILGTGLGIFAGPGRTGDGKETKEGEPPVPAARSAEGAKEPAPMAGQKILEQALQAAADVKDPEQKARALVLVGRAQARAGERAAALETFQRAFKTADTLANDGPNDFLVRGGALSETI